MEGGKENRWTYECVVGSRIAGNRVGHPVLRMQFILLRSRSLSQRPAYLNGRTTDKNEGEKSWMLVSCSDHAPSI